MRSGAIALVFGTRPELVKLAPLAWELGASAGWIHTGQHPWADLAEIAGDLGIGPPDRDATVAAAPAARLDASVAAVADALTELAPDVVVVQGDTNSTLAGALATAKLGLPLVHLEAGLRAFDRRLPEEHNRIVVDHLADVLCSPTPLAATQLADEGIAATRIVVTGNTAVDAVHRVLPDRDERITIRAAFDLRADGYAVATLHRPENVDDAQTLATIVEELRDLPLPVLLPVHPRTADRARRAGIELGGGAITVTPPLGYRAFLALAADSAFLVTDSGGVQEEASVIGRPAVVVRRSTERPEVLGTVTTRVDPGPAIGAAARAILTQLPELHQRLAELASPYGGGDARFLTIAAIEQLMAPR